ncbi:YggT family protein [Homoserinimonas sp. OAct 916]|uniref:YggT family protein n=1 Tax=Homoserinimonas sp. OAct 916 TaxID=2211450 RepID=UPI000DBE8C23|nr:YggT family protein [Homoserinimonas sp. OAct 916]
MSFIATILYFAFLLYFFALWARFILDLIRAFNRSWRPHGFGLVATEAVYSITDPPIKFFRRIIPPIRLGPIALDLGFTLTMLICLIGMVITGGLR